MLNKVGINTPFHAQWEIIYNCNLKCDFCNVWNDKEYNQKELDTEKSLKLIDELSDVGIVFLNITGGEPLLKKDIVKILNYAKQKGLYVSMNSNGLLLKDRILELKNCLDALHISLDSADPLVHDKLRGKKSYGIILENIKLAKKSGLNIAVNMTVSKENMNGVFDMTKLTEKLGVDLFLTPVSVIPTEFKDRSKSKQLILNNQEYVEIVKLLKQKFTHIKTSDAYLDFVCRSGFNSFQCKASNVSLHIKPDGSLTLPCGYFPKHKFQWNKSIKEIISSTKYTACKPSGTYSFCKDCTLSCFFIPTVMLKISKWSSLLKSYS